MEFKTLMYDKQNDIGIITFNRPQFSNAINDIMIKELIQILEEIDCDDEVKCLIMTGGSRAFIGGGDVRVMADADPVTAEGLCTESHVMMNKIANLSKPVIAAIAGFALGGGCELALACDIRMAAEGSILGFPETNLGIFPGGGGTQRLPRIVGIGWATQMILTGKPIDCDTALKIGLITSVVPVDRLMEEALSLASTLAAKAPITSRITKQCLNTAISTDLASGLLYEQKAFPFLFATQDQKEGMRAFLEKRKPIFKGM